MLVLVHKIGKQESQDLITMIYEKCLDPCPLPQHLRSKNKYLVKNQMLFEVYISCLRKYISEIVVMNTSEKKFINSHFGMIKAS